ncbi:MAG: hypothetical protein M1837_000860 [Sclerophora amabilis]|nr:MAG: hypothetical protein M1837_000860 [Sclerophora amabilis]
MLVGGFGNPRKHPDSAKGSISAASGYSAAHLDGGNPSSNPPLPPGSTNAGVSNASGGGAHNPNLVFQHIHDTASKRISTLDYLRKAHEGRLYWFNTLLFTPADLRTLPSLSPTPNNPKAPSRRSTNYLLLGLSLPTILDLAPPNPLDYLRTLHALLLEFDTYQQIHPPDSTSSSSISSISRNAAARLPSMFKRSAIGGGGGKGRRASSAADIGLPLHVTPSNGSSGSTVEPSSSDVLPAPHHAIPTTSTTLPPPTDSDLLPGEDYAYLLTPSLPFDPDLHETFATLCDVLMDVYTRLLALLASPTACAPGVGEAFSKADARVRKILVQGVVKDFEEASRGGARSEVAGVGKVVLGGLM